MAKDTNKLVTRIARANVSDANKAVARVYLIFLLIFTIVFLLNIAGIFIIDKAAMTIAYTSSVVLLSVPAVFNYVYGPGTKWLKYVYVLLSCVFILIVTTTVTYHAIVLFVFPVAVASLYFSKKLTVVTAAITIVVTAIGQVAGFVLNWRPDNNFTTWHGLIVFGIIPRAMTLLAVSSLLCFLSFRTSRMMKEKEIEYDLLQKLNKDMIFGFSNIVENRDESTGGHIQRTSKYVELLAKKLKENGYKLEYINNDFISYMTLVAPLHDIGKVSIPDSILKKPGKLTDEEFDIMKSHSAKGADIIHDTFAHIGDQEFREMAEQVARYHHEKWNGRGYPEGLSGEDIPLPARIMSVADVFDAVSSKRCYRDAMNLDECFKIIENGVGTDFDPVIATAFLSMKDQVIQVKNSIVTE